MITFIQIFKKLSDSKLLIKNKDINFEKNLNEKIPINPFGKL